MAPTATPEVLIVGGGIIGASAAYHLAADGVEDVLVLERDGIATKASGRAAGYLSTFLFDEYSAGTDIADYCHSFHESLAVDHDAVTHHSDDAYTVAHTEEGAARLRDLHEKTRVESELLSGEEYGEREPAVEAAGVTAALSFGPGVHTDPYATTRALFEDAQSMGVRLRKEGVTDVSKRGETVRVTTNQGTYEAPVVVAAAGAWSGAMAEMVGVTLPLKPRPSEIAVFETESDVAFPMLNCPDLQLYARQEPNGDLLVGAGRNTEVEDPEAFSNSASESFLQTVAEKGGRITPHLRNAGLVNDWAGLCSATPDRRPLIGETAVDGFYVCAGMSGAGIMHAPFAGRLLADLVTDTDSQFDPAPFDPARVDAGEFEIKNAIDW